MDNTIDIVVTFDSTGSMYPALAEVRRKVESFIDTLFSTVPNLRIGLMAHGDYNDVYEIETIPLTTDKHSLIQFVRYVKPTNGFGNGGELYEKLLHDAQYMGWQAEKRVIVMLGDEPPHYKGKLVHGSAYYDRRTHLVEYDWKLESAFLNTLGITIYPIRCLNRNDSIQFHTELARMNNVPLLTLQQFTNVIPLLTAVVYKQESDERLESYGEELKSTGQLDRGLAEAFNLLLGVTSTTGFTGGFIPAATNLLAVDPTRFQMLHVDKDTPINDFVRSTGATFRTGKGFYELTKRELVQERKEVVLRDSNGDMFSGDKAREMIGLPYGIRGKISPMRNLGYDVFIQSTSANRKLIGGTRFLYEVDYV